MDQKDAVNKQEPIKRVVKQRADGQKSGLAGEFLLLLNFLNEACNFADFGKCKINRSVRH